MKRKISSKEIRGFYFSQIRSLKRTVSHSMKGKPRRKQWGFHIEKGFSKQTKTHPLKKATKEGRA